MKRQTPEAPADDVTTLAIDLDRLLPEGRLGLAVSGGPDSLALLLLAAAARPHGVEAATVDHRLREDSAGEAAMVAEVCATLGVSHETLTVEVPGGSSLQAQAREARYAALGAWAARRGLAAVATAHHADDQAETLLMRLARGSGVGGLAGIRETRALTPTVRLIRPLLGASKAELEVLVRGAGLRPVDDPSNKDRRYDRTQARALLASVDWLSSERLARSASALGEAEEALAYAAARLASERLKEDSAAIRLQVADLPREFQRRLVVAALTRLGAGEMRGPEVERALAALRVGGTCTLGGVKLEGGAVWRLSPAPPRRS